MSPPPGSLPRPPWKSYQAQDVPTCLRPRKHYVSSGHRARCPYGRPPTLNDTCAQHQVAPSRVLLGLRAGDSRTWHLPRAVTARAPTSQGPPALCSADRCPPPCWPSAWGPAWHGRAHSPGGLGRGGAVPPAQPPRPSAACPGPAAAPRPSWLALRQGRAGQQGKLVCLMRVAGASRGPAPAAAGLTLRDALAVERSFSCGSVGRPFQMM